ncbi:uncharacterized protein K489DRAFT_53234 [Dissoconium aciculare CBS 342.82]|uniref:Uncharacterized protein n=1 Tax=Dissoconium aciculare CBS 342.82 TaxID=1314786 RepID=A0A6J3LX39_9PEZI|nr:uncharacterized protein K489DRAFT_53234 [Dissoconium aciculare CBS 342.82]KAF1820316.1 hypothetical protein K489DRAFT_53234 [Dissoconium aciculare CBS 342.82]
MRRTDSRRAASMAVCCCVGVGFGAMVPLRLCVETGEGREAMGTCVERTVVVSMIVLISFSCVDLFFRFGVGGAVVHSHMRGAGQELFPSGEIRRSETRTPRVIRVAEKSAEPSRPDLPGCRCERCAALRDRTDVYALPPCLSLCSQIFIAAAVSDLRRRRQDPCPALLHSSS